MQAASRGVGSRHFPSVSSVIVSSRSHGGIHHRLVDVSAEPNRIPCLTRQVLRQRKLECDVRMFVMPKDDEALKTFGEHRVPLWIDENQVPEPQTLTVLVKKKL